MDVADTLAVQGVGQRIDVELRVRPRSRAAADVDETSHPDLTQSTDELGDRSR
jgi:hypothetical protein